MTAGHSPARVPTDGLQGVRPVRQRNVPSGFLASITSRLRIGPKSLPRLLKDRNLTPDISMPANLETGCMDMQLPVPGQMMVEIGCADFAACLTTADILGPQGKLVAIDSSPAAVAAARKQASRTGATNVEFHLCRVDSIPLPSGTCDWVISRAPVGMAGSRMAVLREISRVLKPGGNMILHDVAIKRLLPPELAETLAVHSYGLAGAIEPGSYETLLRKAGMSGIELELYDLGEHLHYIFEPVQSRNSAQPDVPNNRTISVGNNARRCASRVNSTAPSLPTPVPQGCAVDAWATGNGGGQAGLKLTDYLTAIRIRGQRISASSPVDGTLLNG